MNDRVREGRSCRLSQDCQKTRFSIYLSLSQNKGLKMKSLKTEFYRKLYIKDI